MRPQQQNRRIRGRGNNSNSNNNNNGNGNRRGPNPLTRTYESNGPDVKIRGTAQQVAEKYANLARDAQSSGDRLIAENYLQHAEHYNRIIAAAQAQLQAQQSAAREFREDEDEIEANDGQAFSPQSAAQQNQRNSDDGSGPQPVIEGVPAEVALNERQRAEPTRSRSRANGQAHKAAEASASKQEAPARDSETPRKPDESEAAPVVAAPAPAPAPAPVEAPAEPASIAPAPEAPATAVEETANAADPASEEKQPVKRTRRPRVRKAPEPAVTQSEEAAS